MFLEIERLAGVVNKLNPQLLLFTGNILFPWNMVVVVLLVDIWFSKLSINQEGVEFTSYWIFHLFSVLTLSPLFPRLLRNILL